MLDSSASRLPSIQQSDFQISKIEESVTDNFRFQRNGNENQYKHSAKVMSKLKAARSILENPDMNSQQVVASKEKISEGIGIKFIPLLKGDKKVLIFYFFESGQPSLQ
jgi:hypothetical protein